MNVQNDFSKAVCIAPNIYWIGMYLENDPFQCHPYLIINGDESILVDPGSMLEFDAVVQKVRSLIPIEKIKYIILHHQDPDLCAAVPAIEKLIDRDDLQIVTHSRMSLLIKHYLTTSSYYEVDKRGLYLEAENGMRLEFLTTPYCHSPGAFVTYDPSSKTLFSGDIFGGIDESWEFYAKEDYFDKAKQFHAEYMPSKDILNYALSKIEKLDIELIAPQHGSIIQKPYISGLIAKMKNLDCGLYIDKKYNRELIDIIDELRHKDKALKEKEAILFQKAKMAEMGEMIANIAHQWRQPLSIINTIVAIAREKNALSLIDQNELEKKLGEIEKNIVYMSHTIEDFMTFFRPNKEKGHFLLREAVENAVKITFPSTDKHNMEVNIDGDEKTGIDGYINEYVQVIVSMIFNAKDILLERETSSPTITIHYFSKKGQSVLEIEDNAGGVEEKYMQRIFEPYFTTKHRSMGTGLGLYISKMIIENSMDGELSVNNTVKGAKFRIGVKSASDK